MHGKRLYRGLVVFLVLGAVLLATTYRDARATSVSVLAGCTDRIGRRDTNKPPGNELYVHIQVQIQSTGECWDLPWEGVVRNNRTLASVRPVFERVGIKVEWEPIYAGYDNPDQFSVWAIGNYLHHDVQEQKLVRIKVGENVMRVNGEEVELDVPAQIVGPRTRIPIRAFAQAYDAEVDYDYTSRTAVIQFPQRITPTDLGDREDMLEPGVYTPFGKIVSDPEDAPPPDRKPREPMGVSINDEQSVDAAAYHGVPIGMNWFKDFNLTVLRTWSETRAPLGAWDDGKFTGIVDEMCNGSDTPIKNRFQDKTTVSNGYEINGGIAAKIIELKLGWKRTSESTVERVHEVEVPPHTRMIMTAVDRFQVYDLLVEIKWSAFAFGSGYHVDSRTGRAFFWKHTKRLHNFETEPYDADKCYR